MKIRVLPQTLINQIAAGEVVVRMANVVKELVENSIDAGATQITVRLSNDARDVEVIDDGSGMNRDDAELSLQRHATSKIRSVEDLFHLMTRGFRGEAIPSIASVSRMEIQTREASSDSGTRLVVEGGRITRIEAVGCPPGTRIQIRDLFYNTPARLKFLKTVVGESNAVMALLTRHALAQPTIGFLAEKDERPVLDLPRGQSLADRFASLMGSQLKGALMPVDWSREGVRIHGILGHPHDARSDRRSQYLFINERPFSNRTLVASMEQACRGFVMTGKFPIACIFVEVAPEEVDFNVHPTKEEVRFRDERMIAGTVYHAIQNALEGSSALVGEMRLPDGSGQDVPPSPRRVDPQVQPAATTQFQMPGFFKSPEQLIKRAFDRKIERQQDVFTQAPANPAASIQQPPAPAAIKLSKASSHHDGSVISAGPGERPDHDFWSSPWEPEPLGQIANTYVIARYGDDLLLIDQHAAHERLVFLKFQRQEQEVHTQPLMIPITVELTPTQDGTARDLSETLEALGFRFEEFGPRTWAITSLPADLPSFDPVPMILDLLDDFEDAKRRNALQELRDRILIRAACHSSIRAGASLSLSSQKELLMQIKAEKLSFTCPHGRPTIVRLTKSELDKQFKRIV